MSTKNTTTGSNSTAFQFDPQSMQAYLQNLSTTMPFLRSNVTNPFGSDAFRQESAINQDNALNIGQRNKSNIINNAAALGYGTNGALFNSMIARAGRDTSGLQAQGFRSAVGNAVGRQMQSAAALNAFQPLMTGSSGNFNTTQTTSGLGTWLPQLVGSAAGAAMNAFAPKAGAAASGSVIPKFTSASIPDPGFGNFPSSAFGGMPNISTMFPSIPPSNGAYGYRVN